jgi:transposase
MRGQITLNDKQQKRLLILNKVNEGKLTAEKAAELMARSLRQVRRLLARYRSYGAAAVVHGNQGRTASNAIRASVGRRIVKLAQTRYAGFNQQHFTELLAEREGMTLSRSSVRRLLERVGIRSPRQRRVSPHRSRRERFPQEGMLVQIDGSFHRWFGPSHPRFTLFAAIDDATGKVLHALFRQSEDAQGYFQLLRGIVDSLGCPMSVYRDRHGIFQANPKQKSNTLDEQLRGYPDPTQFGRLLKELGIESIPAGSPQAKGRIERLFGTFQDRVVNELRLDSIRNLKQANTWIAQFLPRYNRRFAVPARIAGAVWRPIPASHSCVY